MMSTRDALPAKVVSFRRKSLEGKTLFAAAANATRIEFTPQSHAKRALNFAIISIYYQRLAAIQKAPNERI